ncbi:MAG: hypothetical protein LUC31_00340 [Coprobacillus sp.]|nr:hypothetical protein [Coprobacillus sp.]
MAYKTRKTHNVLIIVILAIVFILVVPITFIYTTIYDDERTDNTYDTSLTLEDVFMGELYDSITLLDANNRNNDKYFFYQLTDYDISSLLHSLLGGYLAELGLDDYVDNYYVEIENGQLNIYLEVSISFFKTRLIIETSLETYIDYNDYHNSAIYFTILAIKIGDLGLKNLLLSLLDSLLDMNELMKSIQDMGFSLEYDSENTRFVYPIDGFTNDITRLLGEGDASLYVESFLDILVTNNLLFAGTDYGNSLYFAANVGGFITGPFNEYEMPIDDVVADVEYLLDLGVITTEEERDALYAYLCSGYSKLTDSQQTIIRRLNLTYIGISNNDKETYGGVKEDLYIDDFTPLITNNFDPNGIFSSDGLVFKLPISDISRYFGSLDINGAVYFLQRDNELKYIGISNIAAEYNTRNREFVFAIDLSIDGEIISITISFEVESSEGVMTFKYSGNGVGGYSLSDQIVTDYIDQLSDAFSGSRYFSIEGDTFIIDLNLDFSSILGDYMDLLGVDDINVDVVLQLDSTYLYAYAYVDWEDLITSSNYGQYFPEDYDWSTFDAQAFISFISGLLGGSGSGSGEGGGENP